MVSIIFSIFLVDTIAKLNAISHKIVMNSMTKLETCDNSHQVLTNSMTKSETCD